MRILPVRHKLLHPSELQVFGFILLGGGVGASKQYNNVLDVF